MCTVKAGILFGGAHSSDGEIEYQDAMGHVVLDVAKGLPSSASGSSD